MDSFEERKRLDNTFSRLMSDPSFCKKFDIQPGMFKNIAQGLASENKYISALALTIKEINNALVKREAKLQVSDASEFKKLEESEKKTLYRKIVMRITQK